MNPRTTTQDRVNDVLWLIAKRRQEAVEFERSAETASPRLKEFYREQARAAERYADGLQAALMLLCLDETK